MLSKQFYPVSMLFRHEELVEREIEIGNYLVQGLSLSEISETTGLHKKLIVAYLHNIMEKLKTKSLEDLSQILKKKM